MKVEKGRGDEKMKKNNIGKQKEKVMGSERGQEGQQGRGQGKSEGRLRARAREEDGRRERRGRAI